MWKQKYSPITLPLIYVILTSPRGLKYCYKFCLDPRCVYSRSNSAANSLNKLFKNQCFYGLCFKQLHRAMESPRRPHRRVFRPDFPPVLDRPTASQDWRPAPWHWRSWCKSWLSTYRHSPCVETFTDRVKEVPVHFNYFQVIATFRIFT